MKIWTRRALLLFFAALTASWAWASIDDIYRVGSTSDAGSVVGKVGEALLNFSPYNLNKAGTNANLSQYFLGKIFGGIDYALEGNQSGPSGLISILFRIFNLGILSVSALILVYSSVFSVSTTSHDGGALGSGRFSPFSLARVVGSMVALLPNFSGYSLIQVLVMKVVVAGAVVADITWDASLDYIEAHGKAIFHQTGATDDAQKDSAIDLIKNLNPDGQNRTIPLGQANIETDGHDYNFYVSGSSQATIENMLNPINLAILESASLIKPCLPVMHGYVGSQVRAKFTQYVETKQVADGVQERIRVDLDMRADNTSKTVHCFDVVLTWPDVSNLTASQYERNVNYSHSLRSYISSVSTQILDQYLQEYNSMYSDEKVAEILAAQLRLFYFSIRENHKASVEPTSSSFFKHIKKQGWISAGMNYRALLQTQAPKSEKNTKKYFDMKFQDAKLENHIYSYGDRILKPSAMRAPLNYNGEAKDNMQKMIRVAYKNAYEQKAPPLTNASVTEMAYDHHMNSSDGVMAKLEVPPLDGIGDYFEIELIKIDSSVIMNEIQYMSSGITRATLDVMRGNSNQNPIYDVQTLGDDMLKYTHSYFSKSTKLLYEQVTSAAESAYTMSSLISLARGTIKGLVARNKQRAVTAAREKNSARKNSLNRSNARLSALNKFGGMIFDPIEHLIEFSLAVAKAVISVYLPLGNGLAVVYFTAGLILAAYIPFAPMLIYTFSVLAWIFSVIEAMIAAPIVMIGFANPEGHEMLGKTEQAIMLLVGVFIRPFITLIGFMLSMLMSFSLIKLFNSMMLVSSLFFFKNLLQADIDLSIAIMFGIAGLVVLYAYSLMVIMQQCYSMIYVIPDQILKWIGGPAESAGSGVAQVMRSVQTGLSQQSQSAASGVGSAAGGSVQISTKN